MKFGEEWRDTRVVSEEVFLSFLTKRYIQARSQGSGMRRFLEKDPVVMLEELLGRPLRIEPHNPETFTAQYAEIHGEWRRLEDEGIAISITDRERWRKWLRKNPLTGSPLHTFQRHLRREGEES
jgi:hypothetical protein